MPSQPPRMMEAFVAFWIPPSCREEVLGDLCEQYVSPLRYLFLAMRTVPCVILSRARRVTEAPVLFMEALLVYGCYLVAAWYRDSAFLYGSYGLLRTALPVLPFLLVIVFFDVYYPRANSILRMIGSVAFAALFTFLVMFRAACGQNSLCLARTLPDWMNLLGASASLLLVSAVRVFFRRNPDLQQAAGPAHWLKQTPAPIALPRTTLGTLALIAGITFATVLLMAIGSKPGALGAVIAFCLLFGFRGIGSRKD